MLHDLEELIEFHASQARARKKAREFIRNAVDEVRRRDECILKIIILVLAPIILATIAVSLGK